MPVDGAIRGEVQGDGVRWPGVVAFDDLKDDVSGGVFLVRRGVGDHDDGAGDAGNGGGTDETLGGTAVTGFTDAHDPEDGDSGVGDDIHEGMEGMADGAFAGAVGTVEEAAEGIDDEELDVVGLDDGTEMSGVVAEIDGAGGPFHNEDAIEISVIGGETRPDDAGGIILGAEDEDVGEWGDGAIRERFAGGEGGDDSGDDGGFTVADVSAEDGEHTGGDPAGPEPGEGRGGDIGETGGGGGGWAMTDRSCGHRRTNRRGGGGIWAMTGIARTNRLGVFEAVGDEVAEFGDVHGWSSFVWDCDGNREVGMRGVRVSLPYIRIEEGRVRHFWVKLVRKGCGGCGGCWRRCRCVPKGDR